MAQAIALLALSLVSAFAQESTTSTTSSESITITSTFMTTITSPASLQASSLATTKKSNSASTFMTGRYIDWLHPSQPNHTQAYVGSVISICSGSTVAALRCTSDSNIFNTICDSASGPTQTYTFGPSGVNYGSSINSAGVSFANAVSCTYDATTRARCVISITAESGDVKTSQKTSTTYSLATAQVLVTAGGDLVGNHSTCTSAAKQGNGGVKVAVQSIGGLGFAALLAVTFL